MFRFYLSEAFRIFRRSSFTTFVTISFTTLAVLLTTVSFFLFFISNNLSNRIKKNISVNVYLDQAVDSLQTENIKRELLNLRNIAKVTYISKEEAVRNFIKETGEDFSSVLEENPLPRSFVVGFTADNLNEKNIASIISDIEKIPGINEVVYDYSIIIKILRFLNSIKYVIYTVAAVLIFISIYLVYVNNQGQILANKNLYNTIKLVGAKISTIKIPVILNSIIIGIISGLISFIICSVVLILLANLFYNYSFLRQNNYLLVVCLIEGVVIAFIGSYLASRKLSIRIND